MSVEPPTVAVIISVQTHWDHSDVAAEQVLVCRVMVQLVHLSTSVKRVHITVPTSVSMMVPPSLVHADQDIC